MSEVCLLRVLIADSLAATSQKILAAVDKIVAGYEEESLGFRREIDRQREQLELLQLLKTPNLTLHGESVTVNRKDDDVRRENLTELGGNIRCLDSNRKGNRPLSETEKCVNLRIRIMEDLMIDVLSNNVLKKCPVLNLQSPCGLSESEFLGLLRSKLPQLDGHKELEFFTSDRRRRLLPLHLKKLTAEEITGKIGSEKSMVFIRPKKNDNQTSKLVEDSTTLVLRMPLSNNRYPVEEMKHVLVSRSALMGEVEDNSIEKREGCVNNEQELQKKVRVGTDSGAEWEPASKMQQVRVLTKKTKKRGKMVDNALFCKVCNSLQNSMVKLIQHALGHADDLGGMCGVCGETTELLLDHLHSVHQNTDHHICGDSLLFKHSLNEHEASHSEEKPVMCHESLALEESPKNHQRLHEVGSVHKTYQDVFVQKEDLTHATTKSHECGVCGKSLSDYRSLSRHKLTHTEERPHSCGMCGRCFKLIGTLRTHEKIHTDRERSFLCDVCCKMFLTSKQLQIHMRQHTDEKPYHCSKCGKDFTTRGTLTVHMRVHTGEKPYPCPHCSCAFKRKCNLDEHMTVHSGVKAFVCGTCGKACARKTHLTVHMRTHNGEKPYKCNVCGKGFTQSHCLKTHKKTHQMNESTS